MDKMENNSGAETNTASTLCMKAVRFNRGRGREEESARPVEVRFGIAAVATQIATTRLCCNCEKNRASCTFCN